LAAFPEVIKGWRVADVVTVLSTFDIVVPDLDR
jgi:NADH:ubiquinone oxidoreductase subunit D